MEGGDGGRREPAHKRGSQLRAVAGDDEIIEEKQAAKLAEEPRPAF